MKKIVLLLVTLFSLNAVTYASFPITENGTTTELIADDVNLAIEAPVSNIDWGLLAWCYFLGILGVHRFILGDTWIGILQLLTFGGLYVWWIIDIVKILTGKLSR